MTHLIRSATASFMTRSDPILIPTRAKGSLADCGVSILSGLGLIGAVGATLWFFAGFFETDPGLSPASAGFLLSFGLGAFAIIPCALICRMSFTAWRDGFQVSHGIWSLILAAPWPVFGVIALRSEWLPLWLGWGTLLLSFPILIWALVSLGLERKRRFAS